MPRLSSIKTTLVSIFVVVAVAACASGCSFSFELTSQRTALENQILGSYKQLDEDFVMVASVSATDAARSYHNDAQLTDKERFQKAQLNREFNSIDIADLKDEQILGETWEGGLVVLPKGIGLVEQASQVQLKLAEIVTYEENRDRQLVWQRTVDESEELTDADLVEVRAAFVRKLQQLAKPGHWFLPQDGGWQQRTVDVDEE